MKNSVDIKTESTETPPVAEVLNDYSTPIPIPSPVPASKKEKPPIYRVGRITCGIMLICSGVVMLLALFLKDFDISFVLKLSPVIFIFLGIEILISSFFAKSHRIKVDFLSSIVCLLLVFSGLGMAAVPYVWEYCGPEAMTAEREFRHTISDDINKSISSNSMVVSSNVNVHTPPYTNLINRKDLFKSKELVDVNLSLTLSPTISTKEDFAIACKEVLTLLKNSPYSIYQIEFYSSNEDVDFSLNVNHNFTNNLNIEALVAMTDDILHNNDESSSSMIR